MATSAKRPRVGTVRAQVAADSAGGDLSLTPGQQAEFDAHVSVLRKKAKTGKPVRGVLYVGHLPHGFYEEQMNGYFGQFGKITRLRVSRSRKTGNAKGYAFIEFEDECAVKAIVESMDGYLMFNKLLKCAHIPNEKVHENTFKNCERKFRKPVGRSIAMRRHNRFKSANEQEVAAKKLSDKTAKKLEALAAKGIVYKFDINDQKPLSVPETSFISSAGNVSYQEFSDPEIVFKTPSRSRSKKNIVQKGATTCKAADVADDKPLKKRSLNADRARCSSSPAATAGTDRAIASRTAPAKRRAAKAAS